jgi:hypothetical protein
MVFGRGFSCTGTARLIEHDCISTGDISLTSRADGTGIGPTSKSNYYAAGGLGREIQF